MASITNAAKFRSSPRSVGLKSKRLTKDLNENAYSLEEIPSSDPLVRSNSTTTYHRSQ